MCVCVCVHPLADGLLRSQTLTLIWNIEWAKVAKMTFCRSKPFNVAGFEVCCVCVCVCVFVCVCVVQR